ncbi:MAG: Na+/H+ antiporter NhaC [Cyclobacteriaceae bacterium]|nr:Na+/H+ antiporter NhaC [Cyclobacteriaceae bacterium]
MTKAIRRPTLSEALIPIIFLLTLLSFNVYVFGSDSLEGSNQMVLLISAAVAALVSARLNIPWSKLEEGIVSSISSAMSSMLILLLIGALAGTWLISGIVPAMIYYGLLLLNPTILLFAACLICALVSVATGSSWTTIATVGLALIGIGTALGIPEGVVAGAIISGAYFGDKMSPLSDTTNLAPAMAGTDLFTHIRYMALTTVPSITISLLIFLIMGFYFNSNGQVNDIQPILNALQSEFNINYWLFLVPVAVLVMILKKVPALPALFAGAILGAVFALIFQPHVVQFVADGEENPWIAGFKGIMKALYTTVDVESENVIVDELLKTRGMAGMLNTIWLIICAMIYGGIMDASGMLKRITESIISVVNSTGSLVASTASTCIFFNITASDQYLSIVVPGKMFAKTYEERNLQPQNLSRTLEDSGTVTSVLVPWNTCGATQSSILGVATMAYLPFAFFCLISPFMTVFFAYAGIKIARIQNSDSND